MGEVNGETHRLVVKRVDFASLECGLGIGIEGWGIGE